MLCLQFECCITSDSYRLALTSHAGGARKQRENEPLFREHDVQRTYPVHSRAGCTQKKRLMGCKIYTTLGDGVETGLPTSPGEILKKNTTGVKTLAVFSCLFGDRMPEGYVRSPIPAFP